MKYKLLKNNKVVGIFYSKTKCAYMGVRLLDDIFSESKEADADKLETEYINAVNSLSGSRGVGFLNGVKVEIVSEEDEKTYDIVFTSSYESKAKIPNKAPIYYKEVHTVYAKDVDELFKNLCERAELEIAGSRFNFDERLGSDIECLVDDNDTYELYDFTQFKFYKVEKKPNF